MNHFIPGQIVNSLSQYFEAKKQDLKIEGFSFASGGCINTAGLIETDFGKLFIKWNDREKFPGMFEVEAKGLQLLEKPGVIRVPKVLSVGVAGSYSYILLEYISSGPRSGDYWEQLGTQLALLHQFKSDKYGLDHDNYIGSLEQKNRPDDNWISFYTNQRLDFQLKMAVDNGKMGQKHITKFNDLYTQLDSLLPGEESPCLIHGDLWGGNLMTGPFGEPVIFDPAVYFGHREVELAMTRLFGGYSTRFYQVYQEVFPLIQGSESRVELYQLYPLMVHVNLFGGGYVSQVESILSRYS